MKRAVFLDRDGVLIQDVDLLTRIDQLRVLPGVPAALRTLRDAGFALVVVTNQPVIARGLATEAEVEAVHLELSRRLLAEAAPPIDRYYYCPHHPEATLATYRVDCDCRKPRPGMLLRAARDLELDLLSSFLVGDRLTDIQAGAAAGARTVLVETGMHDRPPIITSAPLDPSAQPQHRCRDLPAAAAWILSQR